MFPLYPPLLAIISRGFPPQKSCPQPLVEIKKRGPPKRRVLFQNHREFLDPPSPGKFGETPNPNEGKSPVLRET